MAEPDIFKHVRPLVEAGFAVHWLRPKTKRPYGNDWSQKPVASFDDLTSTYRKGNNVGVRLGRFSQVAGLYLHVLDIDIRDDDLTDEAFERLAGLFPGFDLDSLPMVRSGSGGASRHLYLLTERPFASKKLAHSATKFTDDKGKKHWDWEIELFGTGKQVAMPPSIHPDTGKPYAWVREFDWDMLDLGVAPSMSADLLGAVAHTDLRDEALAADDEDGLLALARTSPPLGLTEDACRDILNLLPVDDWCDDRDGWLKVGAALHHEFEGADEGFDLWVEFSQKSDKFDESDQRRVWNSFKPNKTDPLTMGYFRKMVQEDGLSFEAAQESVVSQKGFRAALAEAAKYDLEPWEQDVILSLLSAKAKADDMSIDKAGLRKSLNAARRSYLRDHPEDGGRISLEQWLAQEVLRVFFADGDHLIYVADRPWRYCRGVWAVTDDGFIKNRVHRVISKLMAGANGAPPALRAAVQESDRPEHLNALTNSVKGVLETMCAVDSSQDPLRLATEVGHSVMNCTNAEIWFKKGTFDVKDHDPANRFTNQVAAAYDPDAECPEWDAALERIFRDVDDTEDCIRHLHELMGYLVQSSRDLAAWVLFYGVGSNGKSFVAKVLQYLMGRHSSVSMDLAELSRDKHATASLVGKLMMLEDDFKEGAQLPDGMIKKLSESKLLTANPKFGHSFDFANRATPVVLSNHWPQSSDLSHGLARRAQVFHFNSVITEKETDLELFNRIAAAEFPGILNRLIDGWSRVQKRGGFDVPESCQRAKDLWLSNRNSLASFMGERLEVTGDPDDQVRAIEVWDAFKFWSMENNGDTRWGRNRFYSKIEQINGVSVGHPNRHKTFIGMKLLGEIEFEGEDLDVLDLLG